jgi:hypothetical protein
MSAWNSDPTKLEIAECDASEVVLGSGAYIYSSYGYVGLQVMRASLNTDFTYAQGREEEALFGYLVRRRVRGVRALLVRVRVRDRAVAVGVGGLGVDQDGDRAVRRG